MRTIQELQDELSHKLRSAQDILEKAEKDGNRTMTKAEKDESDKLIAEAAELRKDIEEIQDHEKRAKKIRDEVAAMKTPAPAAAERNNPNADPEARNVVVTSGYRLGKLKSFSGKDAEAVAYKAGQWLRATLFGDYRAQRWCQNNGVECRAQSEGTNSAGGFLVPEEFSQAIIDQREQYGVFRQHAQVVPMGRDSMNIPKRLTGLTAYFTGENVELTESNGTWGNVQLNAKKLAILNRVSAELDADAIISLADNQAQEMAYALALKEDQTGFNGDGTSTYGGIHGLAVKIMTAAHSAAQVDCVTAGHDTFAEVDNADLAALMAKLPAYARPNAKFFCSSAAESLVFGRLKAIAGGNTVQTIEGSPQMRYLGKPVIVSEVLPTSTGDLNNSLMLLYGDLSLSSSLGDRRGIEIARSGERYFEFDQVGYRATSRIDIVNHSLGDTSAAGPVVALVGFTS